MYSISGLTISRPLVVSLCDGSGTLEVVANHIVVCKVRKQLGLAVGELRYADTTIQSPHESICTYDCMYYMYMYMKYTYFVHCSCCVG